MLFASTAMFTIPLLLQTAPFSGTAPEGPSASAPTELGVVRNEVSTPTMSLFSLVGMCEARLPPSLVATVTYPFSAGALVGATDEQRARVAPLALAYADGSRSPRAVTITEAECAAELDALAADVAARREDRH